MIIRINEVEYSSDIRKFLIQVFNSDFKLVEEVLDSKDHRKAINIFLVKNSPEEYIGVKEIFNVKFKTNWKNDREFDLKCLVIDDMTIERPIKGIVSNGVYYFGDSIENFEITDLEEN